MLEYRYESLDRERLMSYRLEKTKELFKKDIDLLLLTDACNVRFASDVRGYGAPELQQSINFILINEDGEQLLMTQAFKDFPLSIYPWIKYSCDIPAWRGVPAQEATIADLIASGAKTLGVNSGRIGTDYLTFQIVDEMKNRYPEYPIVSVFKDIALSKMVKSSDEIERLKIASAWNDIGMEAASKACIIGNNEFDVVSACIGALAKVGGESLTHYPGVRSGERTFHDFKPVGRTLTVGDPVIIDCGLYAEGGYASDFCRTFFVDEPSEELKKCYAVVRESLERGIEAMKPGVPAFKINQIINDVLVNYGYSPSIYANGHGIGMAMVELPPITLEGEELADIVLEENMVICLEPITFCEDGGVKLEDVALVTKNGGERLTKTPYLKY